MIESLSQIDEDVPNLFSTLELYGRKAPENYLTESLVFLVKLMIAKSPHSAAEVLSTILGIDSQEIIEKLNLVSLETQLTTPVGTPDIAIEFGTEYIAYVEIKHDSPLGIDQLQKYYNHLKSLSSIHTQLILLCRSRLANFNTSLEPNEFRRVNWYQIFNVLDSINHQDEIVRFCSNQFQQFLEIKNMSMQQVNWQYIEGLPGLLNIIQMIEAALEEVFPKRNTKRTGGWFWRGFKVGKTVFCGVYYTEHLKIVLENSYEKDNALKYNYKRHLNLNEVHFFSLSKDDQFEAIVEFLKNNSESIPD